MKNQSDNNTKLQFWQDKLKKLEEVDLPEAMKRIGESAAEGDWHENAEYEDAVNQKQLLEVQIKELRVLVDKLKDK